jgi:hypothetical protein
MTASLAAVCLAAVGPEGGSAASLSFAVIGDTRPAMINDTAHYPSAIIERIYEDLNRLDPRPEFILTTGDYMFADPATGHGLEQVAQYMRAESRWRGGPVFHVMGNHECNGFTAGNLDLSTGACDGAFSNNYQAFFTAMVRPLGKRLPYYVVPIDADDGSWSSKFIIVACNAWSSAQEEWLRSELTKPTTFTFVVRHEDYASTAGPCVRQMNAMLSTARYDALITGHKHTFQNNLAGPGREIIVGHGGAGAGGPHGYGYAIFEQRGLSFTVTDYDYVTGAPRTRFQIHAGPRFHRTPAAVSRRQGVSGWWRHPKRYGSFKPARFRRWKRLHLLGRHLSRR